MRGWSDDKSVLVENFSLFTDVENFLPRFFRTLLEFFLSWNPFLLLSPFFSLFLPLYLSTCLPLYLSQPVSLQHIGLVFLIGFAIFSLFFHFAPLASLNNETRDFAAPVLEPSDSRQVWSTEVTKCFSCTKIGTIQP